MFKVIAGIVLGSTLVLAGGDSSPGRTTGIADLSGQRTAVTLVTESKVNNHTEYHIRFNTEFMSAEPYQKIMEVLVSAKKEDVINVYLAGVGGDVDVVIQLINGLKETKATVNMIVEAPVYSGHAYLAMHGTTLKALPYVYFMFHHSSGLNSESRCQEYKGKKDRGYDIVEKCMDSMKAHLDNVEKQLQDLHKRGLLSDQDLVDINKGKEVYITGEEMNKRWANQNDSSK